MSEQHDPVDETPFKDVLLARRYLREIQEHGELSRDLEAAIAARGRNLVESVAHTLQLLERRRKGPWFALGTTPRSNAMNTRTHSLG